MNLFIPAKTVMGESRGQGYMGQVAVAWVIRNRAEHARWWGGPDWVSVCLSPWQFSCWNPNNPNRRFLERMTYERSFSKRALRQCWRATLGVYDGAIPDPTVGATHYVVSSWLDDPDLRPAWADELTRTRTIQDHTFFTTLR